ncbi:hypothetical protein G3N56_02495 [Desulfovibrio sulfodismutans]|uniref:Uncharacterized protein n=1 Tax=Desulfolutivibrio sulfodismutans TaxID=63561 RepID=A0A7K3NHF1_9BACT|nr:hypothetical protein [Desulfolutivibrio sulfodismutans]NDY55612.1 hypothetical protein [Desulfolutivibrio sulfodismutans]QLA11686.1 hypothetical protein GD606_05065 [Desulfolutivibrio sulfodismutans DSM 3696]
MIETTGNIVPEVKAKKVQVLRTLTQKEIEEIADKLIIKCKDMKEGDPINPKDIAKEYNISLSLVDKVYIKAVLKGMPLFQLQEVVKQKPKSDLPFINSRMSVMIGKSTIIDLNEKIPTKEKHFKANDKFNVELQGDNIVLIRIV